VGVLYGRSETLARAQARIERACAGKGGLVSITGEAGIGKSRLVEQLAISAARGGCEVVWGRCWEAGGAPAYWPWIQVFRGLQLADDPLLESGNNPGRNSEEARFHAFDRAVSRLAQRAQGKPLALVLDDLHAADVPSLLLLLLLARALPRAPILVLGAYRDGEAGLDPQVPALLGKIAREGDVLMLSRLDREAVSEWIRDALPAASREQVEEIFLFTEGHPLFVTEVLRLGLQGSSRPRLLDGLRTLLDDRLSRLPAETRAALDVAAVLGREFSGAELAAIAGAPPDEIHRQLLTARAARVLTAGDAGDLFLFSHMLLRDHIYEALSPSRRATLHWLTGSLRLARGVDPAAAIHHCFAGVAAGEPARAAEVGLAAANAALARYGFEEAVLLCRRAIGLLDRSALPARLPCELQLTLARALVGAGDPAGAKKACALASEQARLIGAGDLLAAAALEYGVTLFAGLGDAELVALLREALPVLAPSDTAMRAKVMARLVAALNPPRPSDMPEMIALAREATALARGLHDEHVLLYVLQSVVAGLVYLVDEDERFALLDEITRLGRRLDQRLAVINSAGWYIGALLGRGRPALAAQLLRDYEELLAEFPQPHLRWRLPLAQALERAFHDDFAAADRASEEGRELAQRGGSGPGLRAWAAQRISFAQMRGKPELIAPEAAQVMALFEPAQDRLHCTAWLLAATGQHEPAARRLRQGIEPYFPTLLVAADVCCMLGDRDLAEVVYPPLLAAGASHQIFWGPSGASALGPTARLLGDLALLLERPADAERHFQEAIAFCERIGAQPFSERIQESRRRAAARVAETSARPSPAAPARLRLRREGDVWVVESSTSPAFRLKHSKGLAYLQYLVEQPRREVHVLELAGVEHATGDAGPLLDARAKADYARRLDALRDQLQEAEGFGDLVRAQRTQQEIEAIAGQLATAVGLGGRDRRAASDCERARINVQRRLKDTIERIATQDPALAGYLAGALHTGTFCSFEPGAGP